MRSECGRPRPQKREKFERVAGLLNQWPCERRCARGRAHSVSGRTDDIASVNLRSLTFVRCHFAAPPYSLAMFIRANTPPRRARCSQALRRLVVLGAVAQCCGGALPAQTPNDERAT